MKNITKYISIVTFAFAAPAFGAEVNGNIKQVVEGAVSNAKGCAVIGEANDIRAKFSHRLALSDAMAKKRIVQLDENGQFSIGGLPHEQWLYVTFYLDGGYGKYMFFKLSDGEVKDVSQTIPDAHKNAVTFTGKLIWSGGEQFDDDAILFSTIVGLDNDWEFAISGDLGGGALDFDKVQPGSYRLEISGVTSAGVDVHKMLQININPNVKDQINITIP